MEIIGIIPEKYNDGEFIIKATKTELRNLLGYKYSNNILDQKLVVGSYIPISEMYNRLFEMANKEKELMEISAKLKAASDFCNTALPTIKNINKSDKKEEEK